MAQMYCWFSVLFIFIFHGSAFKTHLPSSLVLQKNDDKNPSYRLPKNVFPHLYEFNIIEVVEGREWQSGNLTIHCNVTKDTDTVIINVHQKYMEILENNISSGNTMIKK